MTEKDPNASNVTFESLGLSPPVLRALAEVGYEAPSAIQAQTIPMLMSGRDLVGQAQTGTGKTAAFALPLLSRLERKAGAPQVAVLTPTRELAIQVAEAIRKYATYFPDFRVLPIYGGQDYGGQIRTLKRGVHVVVGTPGRVMDHMRRGSLRLDELNALVLDEADEMLRMGFIDDVEWILERTPPQRQVALFSATMPAQIRRIASQYLTDPAEITIKLRTSTAETIHQRYWPVAGMHKLDALTRILEAETFDAAIIFVRTKTATVELCEKLEARGYSVAALNGDIPQNLRERTVAALKSGKIDLLVATDVAARGLDVERISHVINYDVPHDTEAYVHRIGRTGRAGRKGNAILFVAPRERRMLASIERATRQKIEPMSLPSTSQINDKRMARFMQKISDVIAADDLGEFPELIERYQQQHNVPAIDIAAALAKLLQGDTPLLLEGKARKDKRKQAAESAQAPAAASSSPRAAAQGSASPPQEQQPRSKPAGGLHKMPMERFRIEVGQKHDVKPANIVGAIANEAGIDGQFIARVEIFDDHSLLDLPEGMPKAVFKDLKKVWVCGQQLQISRVNAAAKATPKARDQRSDSPAPARKFSAGSGKPRRPGKAPPHSKN